MLKRNPFRLKAGLPTRPELPMPIANETTFIEIAGKKTQVMRGGDGPPIVYLHSAGGETDWTPFHDQLAKSHTVYAPAHPGFALSDGLEAIDNIHDMVWHYVDFFEEFHLERVPVVGFSLGAWLGIELAILRPHLVSKLAMINAAGLHVDGAPMAELFIDDFEKIKKMLFFNPEHESVELAMPLSLDDSRILMWLRAREATARVGWNPYLHNPKLKDHLHRVKCPTLVVWGREDQLIPLAHGKYYAAHVPGAELIVLEDCGHMAPFEKCEETAEAVLKFLKG